MTFKPLVIVLAAVALFGAGDATNPWRPNTNIYPVDVVDELQDEGLERLAAYLARNGNQSNCTLETAAKRMEWSDLTVAEREQYVEAVLCLQALPAKAPQGEAPGARSRFDDFVVIHMMHVSTLHSPAHIMPAHRLYTWLYEKALREECGYTGYQPYWNWDRYAADPINSPLFNGNASSLGGNGAPDEYPGIPTFGFAPPLDKIPAAGAGGCVTDGPFKDRSMVVNLGPVMTVLTDVPPNSRRDGLAHNPRCLRRDINRFAASVTTAQHSFDLITESETMDVFHDRLMGFNGQKDWGVHTGGHYTIGGDPGGDFYGSPGDPAFYLHHGMIDRLWWIWQLQDPDTRMTGVAGQDPNAAPPVDWAMGIFAPTPSEYPHKPGDADFNFEDYLDTDTVDFSWLAEPWTLRELLDTVGTTGGDFCYIYV